MAKSIGRNTNTTDSASLSDAIALNALTSTKIADANDKRIFFCISNDSNVDIMLKLQGASLDNDKKGIVVYRKGYWEMPVDNIETGEISAIAKNGNPNIFTTEY